MAENKTSASGIHLERTQIEKYFEVILYYVLFFVVVMSYLPMGVQMNHLILNLMVFSGFIFGVFGYRFMPLEKTTGRIRYTFEQKSLFLGAADVLFVSVAVAASGGAYSPFYFVYIFPILSASLLLMPRHLYIEMGIYLLSLYGAHIILLPDFLNYRFISISIIIFMSYLLALILINERLKRTSELAMSESKLLDINTKLQEEIRESEDRAKYLEDVKNATLNILEDLEKEKNKVIEESQNAKKFQQAAEASTDATIILSDKAEIQYVNPAWTRLTEYSPAESLDKMINFVHSRKAKPEVTAKLMEAIENGSNFVTEEIPIVRKDGSEFNARINLYPIRNEEGVVIFFVKTIQDISERKLLEQQKSEFISVASHQLRTPLSAMNWFLEMVTSQEVGPINDKQRDYLSQVYESSRRLSSLVNDLLNVSRLEAGRMSFSYKEFDLLQHLNDVLKEVQPLAEAKNITFKIIKPDLLPPMALDPLKVHQVLSNLISNAVKYTKGKSVVTITISVEPAGFIISVADQGVGIPKSQQVNIFTKFFRAENVIRLQTEGTGLGLYITKLLVEGMGGKISFVSQENKGTTFTIQLPLKPPAQPSEPPSAPAPKAT